MPKPSNLEIISELQNGNEEVLFYLSRKYFQSSRKWLREHGVEDKRTPGIFSDVLVKVCNEVRQNMISPNVDFESYFFNALGEYVREEKAAKKEDKFRPHEDYSDEQRDIVAQCVSILDDQDQKLLFARYAEKLSFEQIAARFEYDNPVMAQSAVHKVFRQLEGIVSLRLNISLN